MDQHIKHPPEVRLPDADTLMLLALLVVTQAASNECDPNKGCNVCATCCSKYIADGALCDACAVEQCEATTTTAPVPPTTPVPMPENDVAHYYVRYLTLVLLPLALRALQAAVENKVKGYAQERCCGSKSRH